MAITDYPPQIYENKKKTAQEFYEEYIPKGKMPSFIFFSREAHEVTDPKVKEARQKFADFLWEALPFLSPNDLDKLSGKEVLDIVYYYFNNPPSFKHFLSILKFTDSGDPAMRKIVQKIKSKKDIEEEEYGDIQNFYRSYLLHKLPKTIQARFEDEKISDIPELEKIHNNRNKHGNNLLIGFHTSVHNVSGDEVKVGSTREQENINKFTGEKTKIRTGAKFLTFRADSLYFSPGREIKFLSCVEANKGLLKNMYDEATASYSYGNLVIMPDFNNIPLSPEVLKEFGFKFGTV